MHGSPAGGRRGSFGLLEPAAGFGDHLQARFVREEGAQATPYDGVVVSDQDADRTHDGANDGIRFPCYANPLDAGILC